MSTNDCNEQNSSCSSTSASETSSCCAVTEPVKDNCCPAPQEEVSCCDGTKKKNWVTEFLWSAWGLVLLIPSLVYVIDTSSFTEFFTIASTALAGTAPYILFAVLLIAYLKATGAENVVAQAFEGRENRMIVLAALFGGLAPFCSCEVIPFIAGLLALGAPLSAVMAFWLSSPLIDPPSLMITAGALGWEFAFGKALSAIFLGLFGGFGIKLLMKSGAFQSPLKNAEANSCSTSSCNVSNPFSEKPLWKFWHERTRINTFKSEGINNAVFLFKWLSFAYMLEALLILYVPASLIGSIVGGDSFSSIVVGALVGMPAYLNSYAAPPLVAGLMEQGMSAGAAMAFMIAGAISSIPAMTAVWSLVKKEVFISYLGFGVGGAILFGSGFALILSP
ncbi:MAG: permease [Neptuniibacter sp.]